MKSRKERISLLEDELDHLLMVSEIEEDQGQDISFFTNRIHIVKGELDLLYKVKKLIP